MPVSAGLRAAILRQAASGSGVAWRGFGIRTGGDVATVGLRGVIMRSPDALNGGARVPMLNSISLFHTTPTAQARARSVNTPTMTPSKRPSTPKPALSSLTQPSKLSTVAPAAIKPLETFPDIPSPRPPRLRSRRSLYPATHAAPKYTVASLPSRLKTPPRRTLITDVTRQQTPSKVLSFQIAASYSAKQKTFEPAAMSFNFNPYNRVKVEGNSNGNGNGGVRTQEERKKSRADTGQDSFFISRVGGSGGVAMGVADGVGGYSHYGIDSAEFSHTLCENMALLAHTSAKPGGKLHPRTLLYNGYQQLLEENEVRGGASTACVGTIRPDGVLMVANLGDSGFIILRHGKVHYASTPQTHAFNTPYQLSVVPPEVLDQSRLFGGDFLADLPQDAQVTSHHLENGDVVIFATDGVWDNLFPQEILKIVTQEMLSRGGWVIGGSSPASAQTKQATDADEGYISSSNRESTHTATTSSTILGGIQPDIKGLIKATTTHDGTSLQSLIAKSIAGKAKSASLNRHVDGPFAKEVRRTLPGEDFRGGKRDDICVVVGVVVDVNSEKTGGKDE